MSDFDARRDAVAAALRRAMTDADVYLSLAAVARLAAELLREEQTRALRAHGVELTEEGIVSDSVARLENFAEEVGLQMGKWECFRWRSPLVLVIDLHHPRRRDPLDDPGRKL